MRRSLLLLTFACTCTLTTRAQIQSWPPGGITPSPYALLLPDSRYVPSSKRYNMVWSDQLFGLPSGQIEFTAKNYVGTQKIFSYQADDYRAFNPNFLVISYHLAVGLNPLHNDNCPDPKTNSGSGYIGVVAPDGFVSEWSNYFSPWLISHGITVNSAQYENMFQHYDAADSANRVWHIDPQWLMNIENDDWRTYMGDICTEWMSGNENEGCFLDVSVETMATLYNPNEFDSAPYNFNWYIAPHGPLGYTVNSLSDFANYMNEQYLNYYHYLYPRFHMAVVDYLLIPNVDQMVTSWYDPVWIEGDSYGETVDGTMMEGFGNYTGSDMFLTLSRGLQHITGRGKVLIAQFTPNDDAERYRRVGMYMLIKNENSFLCIHPGNVDWYPEYEIDLGDQSALPNTIDDLRVAGSDDASLFKRDYDGGMVLCNTSSSAMSYTLQGNSWKQIITSGGGAVDADGNISSQTITYQPVSGTVSIDPSQCLILRNDTATGIEDPELQRNSMTISQNFAKGELYIHLSIKKERESELKLLDVNGRLIKKLFSGILTGGHHDFETNLADLSEGVYLVEFISEGIECRKVMR